ncbi:MAG TPA: FkbM family methyltransferase, partial [Stellaceae bacterium]|nr:FkbM family methyltransferase [Stellaceae bacterium]
MLKKLARWLSGISEEAARRAVADLGDGLKQLENRLDQRQEALSVTLGYAVRGIAFTNEGTALVRTASEHLTDIFDNLSDDMLLRLAEAMATLGPLATKRHWRFGDFEYSLDLAVHIRRSLWLNVRARGLRDPIIVPWHGKTKLALRLDNDLSLTFFSSGIFEPNEFALLDRLLKPGMVFVDGGANEGLYTLFASARIGERGRVISVEPSPRELGRLRQNLALNAAENVDVVEAALAERSELLSLWVAEDAHSGQNTLGAFAYQGIATSAVVEV